jgi:hypothetical protein
VAYISGRRAIYGYRPRQRNRATQPVLYTHIFPGVANERRIAEAAVRPWRIADRGASCAGELGCRADDQELREAFAGDLLQVGLLDILDAGSGQKVDLNRQDVALVCGWPHFHGCLAGTDGYDALLGQPTGGVEADAGQSASMYLSLSMPSIWPSRRGP